MQHLFCLFVPVDGKQAVEFAERFMSESTSLLIVLSQTSGRNTPKRTGRSMGVKNRGQRRLQPNHWDNKAARRENSH